MWKGKQKQALYNQALKYCLQNFKMPAAKEDQLHPNAKSITCLFL